MLTLFILAIALILVLLVILVSDGRYFGKPLTRWIYNRIGPALFGSRSEAERWRELAGMLQLSGTENLLDVGAAVGDLSLTMAELPGFQGLAVGVDWSRNMLAAAQQEANRRGVAERVSFQVVDVRDGLPFADDAFDVVTCFGLLETYPHPETILATLVRVLKPTGVLVLSVYRGLDLLHTNLSAGWYRRQLAIWGDWETTLASSRTSQDVLIARRQPHNLTV